MSKLLVVTGATRGIGRNITNYCLPLFDSIISIGSSDNCLKANNVFHLRTNLENYQDIYEKLKPNLVQYLSSIEEISIVLCASQLSRSGGLIDCDLENWAKTYNCNVLGNLAVVKGCLDIFGNLPKYRIAFFGGGGAAYGYPEFSGYALSKVATIRAAENLSLELKTKGNFDSTVIAVAPGAVDTDMLKTVLAAGGSVKTKTDISEPTNFIVNYVSGKFDNLDLDGKFLHIRDDLSKTTNHNLFKLRRTE